MVSVVGAYTTVRVGGANGGHHRVTFHSTGGRWIAGRRRAYRSRRPQGIPSHAHRTVAGFRPNRSIGRKRSGGYHARRPGSTLHHAPVRRARSAALPRAVHHSTGLSALESRRRNMAKARAKEASSARTARQIAADIANLNMARGSGGHRHSYPHASSARELAAARRNLAKARAVAASRPRTPAQLAAARASIGKAQAAARRLPRTPAQIAAAKSNLARGRAIARHRKRTPAQIAASRRNIAKARAARSHRHRR